MTKSFLSKVNVVSIPQLSLEELTSGELASDDWSEHEKIINQMNSRRGKCLGISKSSNHPTNRKPNECEASVFTQSFSANKTLLCYQSYIHILMLP